MLLASTRESLVFDWNGLALGHALRRSITLVLLLALSVALGRPEIALFPVVGAVVVGFGSIRALGMSRATPMLFASFGIALASFAGALVGGHMLLTFAALALAGI